MTAEPTLVLDNATLWIGDGTTFAGHVVVSGDRIESVGRGRYSGAAARQDLNGAALSPGMIDLMVLGGFGKSILRDDPLDIARQYVAHGVTSCGLCIGTLPWDSMQKVAQNVRQAKASTRPGSTRVLGLYLEGPFQHPNLTGASMKEHALPPTPDNVRRIVDTMGDVVHLINVSPGTAGDADAVRVLASAGIVVSMAHSNAPADRVVACIEAGTSVLGHVFDNNSGLIGDSGVQQPTLEHVAFIDERVRSIHLICDGVHVHPLLVKLILRCRGVETVSLVTDGNQRMGMPDGPFVWDDGRSMYKERGVCRTSDKGWLAGSATLLPVMFRNFVEFSGLPPHVAVRTVTLNPAASLGLDDQVGVIAPGRTADLVAWDDRMRVRRVWRGGREVAHVAACDESEAVQEVGAR